MANRHKGSVKTNSSPAQHKDMLGASLWRLANSLPPEPRKPVKRLKPRGSWASANKKLSNEQVREIRARYNGSSCAAYELAGEFGVTEGTVRAIVYGYTRPFA